VEPGPDGTSLHYHDDYVRILTETEAGKVGQAAWRKAAKCGTTCKGRWKVHRRLQGRQSAPGCHRVQTWLWLRWLQGPIGWS